MSHPPSLHSSTTYLHPWSDIEIGVERLSLEKNIAFNVVNEKTTFGLLKALSNMYEKPSASNKFDNEMHALLLLSSLLDSCPSTATTISSTFGMNKLTFEGIRDMILGEDIRRRSSGEYPNSLLSATGHGKKSNRDPRRNQHHTLGTSRVGIVEEYCESCVMDSGASFHATLCMGMMKNFQPLLGKVRLTDIKVLDVTGIGDVVLKTTFGTEWIMKNVRYIPSLKRKLIFIYAPRAELKEKSIREPLRLDLVSPGVLSNIVENLGTCKGSGTKVKEVKYMGGMEVMIVTESEETVKNIVEDAEHGVRRCMLERMYFQAYCRAVGSAHGDEQLDTIDVKLGRNVCKVIVNEEIRDIINFEIKESNEKSGADEVKKKYMKEDDNVMRDESVRSKTCEGDDEDEGVRVVDQMVVGDGLPHGDGGCVQSEDQQLGPRYPRELNVEKVGGVELKKDASTSKKKIKGGLVGILFGKLLVLQCALSLDELAMPPHFHKKFRIGVAIAKKIVEERLTIKFVKGEEVLKIETTVTAKDGTITKFPGKFPEYKPTKEEEEISKLKAIFENVIYDISDSDSDLESTARSGPRDGGMEDTGGSGIRINA
ncbi:hypothetical protein Tco_0714936, partial [Tanacetum coccineum]